MNWQPSNFLKEAKAKLLFNLQKRYALPKSRYISKSISVGTATNRSEINLYEQYEAMMAKKQINFQLKTVKLYENLIPLLQLAQITSYHGRSRLIEWMASYSDTFNRQDSPLRKYFFINFPYATDNTEWFKNCVTELKAQVSMRWNAIYNFLKNNRQMFNDLFQKVENTERNSRRGRENEIVIPPYLRQNKAFLDLLATQSAESSFLDNDNSATDTPFPDRSQNAVRECFLQRIEEQFKQSCEITEEILTMDAVSKDYIEGLEYDCLEPYVLIKKVETFFYNLDLFETVADIRNKKSHKQMFKTDVYDKSVAFWSSVYFAKGAFRELALICMLIHCIPITTVDVERTFKTAKRVDGKEGPLGTEKKEKETILCENFSKDFVRDEVWENEVKNISLDLLSKEQTNDL